MPLHSLPTELLTTVLEVIDDPRDIHSLIRASPDMFRVYMYSRNRVISTVLRNAIQPEALPHAVAACQVPLFKKDTPKEVQTSFLERYFGGNDEIKFPVEKAEIDELFCLCCRVFTCIEDYVAVAWRALHTTTDSQDSKPAAPLLVLSRTERARLQRAFFRHELYCRVFPVRKEHSIEHELLDMTAQFDLFVSRLEAWEVEEMACAHFYYLSVARKAIFELQETYVERILASPRICFNPPDPDRKLTSGWWSVNGLASKKERSTNPDWMDFDNFDFEATLDMVFAEAEGAEFPGLADSLACLGSIFSLDWQSAKTLQPRVVLTLQAVDMCQPTFLPGVLKFHLARQHQVLSNNNADPNGGFTLFKISDPNVYLQISEQGHLNVPLRERAYVFWDVERLQEPTIHASLRWAHQVDREELERLFDFAGDHTCLKKLRGVQVHPLDYYEATQFMEADDEFWCDYTNRKFDRYSRLFRQ